MVDPSDTGSAANLQRGNGVVVASACRNFTGGMPVNTGQPLDLYIEGDGFFTVQGSNGETLYTRSGALSVSSEADGKYLVTADGCYVLDINGNRITLPEGISEFSVSPEGGISFGSGAAVKLGIVTFTNKDGLSLAGSGCYAATAASGAAKTSGAKIRQGYLESSNVDLNLEMTRLMRTQRAYSLAGEVLTAWNEMESETNNIR
jgi:flagellar basal body rod protein FlgG